MLVRLSLYLQTLYGLSEERVCQGLDLVGGREREGEREEEVQEEEEEEGVSQCNKRSYHHYLSGTTTSLLGHLLSLSPTILALVLVLVVVVGGEGEEWEEEE